MSAPTCLDFLEALSRARNLDEVRLVCRSICRHFGFEPFPTASNDTPPGKQTPGDGSHLCPHFVSAVSGMVTAHLRTGASAEAPKAELTRRERECLLWAAEGKTTWEIALILCITGRTVNFHLQNAARKLVVVNRQQAVARAVALGLIRPNGF